MQVHTYTVHHVPLPLLHLPDQSLPTVRYISQAPAVRFLGTYSRMPLIRCAAEGAPRMLPEAPPPRRREGGGAHTWSYALVGRIS